MTIRAMGVSVRGVRQRPERTMAITKARLRGRDARLEEQLTEMRRQLERHIQDVQHSVDRLTARIDAMGVNVSEHLVTAAELRAGRQQELVDESVLQVWEQDLLEPRQAALALGVKKTNREKASALRKRSRLLGIPRGHSYLYPAFQIDAGRREIYPEVGSVNETLGAVGDPWGVASWWLSPNDRLGVKPAELVGTSRAQEVVKAAKAVTAPLG